MRDTLRAPKIRIAPSLLAADFAQLKNQVALVETAGADLLHLDVMDGHFVPNISFGPGLIQSIRPHSNLFFDAHLMIAEPKRYASAFVNAGCDHITFHIEATDQPRDLIDHIHDLGASAGICLNPSTPFTAIESVINLVDLVLIMSVWPGFGGQEFIEEVLPNKAQQLKTMLSPRQRLEIDGGVDPNTIASAANAGVDTFVAGSAIFGSNDPAAAISTLRTLAQEANTEQNRSARS